MKGATLRLVKFNPLFGIIDNFRRSLFGQHMDFNLAVYTWGVSAIAVVIGIIVFYKKQDSFILNI